MLVVMWGEVNGITVGVVTLEVKVLVVCGVGGMVDECPIGVEAPVEVVDTVAGVGVGVEGGPVVDEGGPVVVPWVGVVFEEVGPEVGEPVRMEGAVRAEGVHPS